MAERKTDEAVAATIQTAPGQIEEAAPMQVEEATDPTGVEMGVGRRGGSRWWPHWASQDPDPESH